MLAFSELIQWCNHMPHLRDDVLHRIEQGLPFFRAEIDGVTTATGERNVVYKPSDALLALLATLRAVHGKGEFAAYPILECVCHVGEDVKSGDAAMSST